MRVRRMFFEPPGLPRTSMTMPFLLRTALKTYVNRLFELAKLDTAGAADAVLNIETQLAKAQWTRTELRDANKRYNKFTVEEYSKQTPTIPWKTFFEDAGAPGLVDINVMTPSFFTGLEAALAAAEGGTNDGAVLFF